MSGKQHVNGNISNVKTIGQEVFQNMISNRLKKSLSYSKCKI